MPPPHPRPSRSPEPVGARCRAARPAAAARPARSGAAAPGRAGLHRRPLDHSARMRTTQAGISILVGVGPGRMGAYGGVAALGGARAGFALVLSAQLALQGPRRRAGPDRAAGPPGDGL